ncbi:hypothetical protein [Algoriphagus sp. CAU 1675]|uniref:hypothetical protein n=1 Tax=Algoriphagus sp. CAU 1675 TaxID=3032597 RepID=UPI0023DA18F0|nr:hypothetical protein [Algoriphagus sp. CAU 1675]MDF2158811.1 hypothetical protein [Algoriphagus sp. CAU 1675]
MENELKTYPKGHFILVGMAIGIPIGIAYSISIGNFAFSGVGIAIGVSIGVALEEKYKKEGRIRELTEEDQKKRKKMVGYGFGLFLTGILAFLWFVFRK